VRGRQGGDTGAPNQGVRSVAHCGTRGEQVGHPRRHHPGRRGWQNDAQVKGDLATPPPSDTWPPEVFRDVVQILADAIVADFREFPTPTDDSPGRYARSFPEDSGEASGYDAA
jgi:hypothetical protein